MKTRAHYNNFKGHFATRRPLLRHGFTLLELLVVMALMAILLTLIFKPLLDTFNLTSRAGTQIEAQENAREVVRQVSTTLSNAVYVYDNAQNPIYIWVPKQGGGQAALLTNYAMVEYVRPARQLDQLNNQPIDPTTGDPIYSLADPPGKSGFALPLTQGRTLGRIFIGLANNTPQAYDDSDPNVVTNGMPKIAYANKYDDNGSDNRYMLYKAEAQTFIKDPANSTNYIPNLKLFHSVDRNGNVVDTATSIAGTATYTNSVQIHDPNFFYDNSPAGGKESGAGTATWAVPGAKMSNGRFFTIADNWKAISATQLLPKKADAILLTRDANTNQVVWDNNGKPSMRPLITFAPYYVENDPGTPGAVENAGNEAQAPAAVSYITQYSHWDTPYRVQVFRASNTTDDPMSLPMLTYYQYVPQDARTPSPKIVQFANIPPGTQAGSPNGKPNYGPNVDPATGVWLAPTLPYNDPNFFAYTVDPTAGVVKFAFPWSVLCYDANKNPVPQTYSPDDINASILTGTDFKRYLMLSNLPAALNPTGTAKSPLDPNVFGTTPDKMSRISIVPGSERIFGPDQRPGPHYGYRVQYSRVSASAGVIGPNQYKINYTDVINAAPGGVASLSPTVRAGYIEFDSIPDISEAMPNTAVSVAGAGPESVGENAVPPTDVTTQPPLGFRPHSLPQVRNVGGMNVPAAPVEVTYNFQMNRPNDVVKADYLTRELMNIAVTMRYYDPRSGRPQEMSMTSQVKVRNLQR